MNTMTLYPYRVDVKTNTVNTHYWVFDDKQTGLKAEAFVRGISEMIDRMVGRKNLPNAKDGFAMTFGAVPFEGANVKLRWISEGVVTFKGENGEENTVLYGNWYVGNVAGKNMVGWLCPALLKYFPAAPSELYVAANPLPEGVDPIWHDAPKPETYVSPDLINRTDEIYDFAL